MNIRLQNQLIINLQQLDKSEKDPILQHLKSISVKVEIPQKYHKNRLLCGSNLPILLYGRRQRLHLLRVTLYMRRIYVKYVLIYYKVTRKRCKSCRLP